MMHHPLHRFMLGVLVWLPVAFLVWYVTAPWHLAPITLATQGLLNWLVPDALLWLRLDGGNLVIASNFGQDASGTTVSPPIDGNALGFHVNPLIYCYSLPLLAALTLATPGDNKAQKLLWGLLALLPTELFSMAFSVLKVLAFDVGTAFLQQQGLDQWAADGIALGYQLGTLLLPMVAPLIIWISLHRDFFILLAPQVEQTFYRKGKHLQG